MTSFCAGASSSSDPEAHGGTIDRIHVLLCDVATASDGLAPPKCIIPQNKTESCRKGATALRTSVAADPTRFPGALLCAVVVWTFPDERSLAGLYFGQFGATTTWS